MEIYFIVLLANMLSIILLEYIPPDDNSKQKDLAFVGYTFKRFESLTKRNAL